MGDASEGHFEEGRHSRCDLVGDRKKRHEDNANISGKALPVFLLQKLGFLSSAVLNAIFLRRTNDRVGNIVEAPALSLLIYAVLSPFDRSPVDLREANTGMYRSFVTPELLLYAMGLAVGLALLLGLLITNDYHMELLRKMKITASTA